MKYLLSLLIFSISCGSFAQSKKSAKWSYLGVGIGRGSPIEGKALSYGSLFYESHFDDLDLSLAFEQSFASELRVANYTVGMGKSFERNEGPNLRVFVGAGINSIISEKHNFEGVQSTVGLDICPPAILSQFCARLSLRMINSEYVDKISQEFSLILKKISF